MPSTPAITTGMIDFITRSGFITPIDDTPTPDLAVPYAAPRFAKMSATAAPMKPKNGAEGGQSGLSTMMLSRACGRMTFAVSKIGAAT